MLRHTALRFARVARPRGIRARRCAPTTHRWPPFQPCRGLATAGGEGDKKPAPEPSKWEKIRTLFREHGVAFAGVYTVAYTATFVPLMGALTVGGVDGPELVLWGAEQLRIPYDLTWIQDGPLSKDLINARGVAASTTGSRANSIQPLSSMAMNALIRSLDSGPSWIQVRS